MIIFSQACSPAYFKQQKSTEKSTHAPPPGFATYFANLECPDFLVCSGSPLKERLTVNYLNPLYYREM